MGNVCWQIILTISFLGLIVSGTYQGCYQESVRRRHFSVSPGDYRPEQMTTTTCMAACGTFNYAYAAISNGKFCYCANSLPPPSPPGAKVSNSLCDVPCVGDPAQACGGMNKYVSVYGARKKVSGLVVSTDQENNYVQVATQVNIDVGVDEGVDVVYFFDYDNGGGRTGPNVTDMLTATYFVPGQYDIVVYANDVNTTFQDQIASSSVRVDAPPGLAEVSCDDVFGTYEEGKCTLTLWWGSSITATVAVPPAATTVSVDLEDPVLSLAGPALDGKSTSPGSTADGSFLFRAAEFTVSGRVMGYELDVDTVGDGQLKVLILRPECGDYCYSDNSCNGACASSTTRIVSCTTTEFCAQTATCADSCPSGAASRYATFPAKYEVAATVPVTVTQTGYHFIAETNEVLVEPGYVLGLEYTLGNVVLRRTTGASDETDLQFLSSSDFTVSLGLDVNKRHSLRAVASGGSKAHLPYTFEDPGNFTLTATLSSSTLSAPETTATTTVMVLEGVNASIITGPIYISSGDSVTFVIEPHTGNSVLYNWTISDGFEDLMSTNQNLVHTFTTPGTYYVNATVYNAVSSKSNVTEVFVQDPVTGLSVTALPKVLGTNSDFATTLSTGSDYNCSWNFDDATPTEYTSEVSGTTLGASSYAHMYSAGGSYNVTVNCSNGVSSEAVSVMAVVQELITNLRMVKEGASKNTDYYLEWTVDAGTEITFNLTFDGSLIPTYTTVSKYKWRSPLQPARGASSIPLTLSAANEVGSDSISINFEILSVIVDPTLTTPEFNVSSHTPVPFTVDMAGGSGVTVHFDFGDGQTDVFTQTPGQEWSTPHTASHSFTAGGRFNVLASFSNAEGTYNLTTEVMVLVSVESIACNTSQYALYYPPANASLTLFGTTLPTEPTFTLNWGEPQSRDTTPELVLNTPYWHTFGDTGEFEVTVELANLMGEKTCKNTITVVEKLEGPSFKPEFAKAAVGLPYDVTFCLYRGPSGALCKLDYNFGDGNTKQTDRQGEGMDGCDIEPVVYNDYTTRNVMVNAKTPLETDTASTMIEVIDGVSDADIALPDPNDVSFGSPSQFELTYNGAIMPTDAQILVDYGDGTFLGPIPFSVATQGGTQTFSHTYSSDGLFEAVVTIYNDATRVNRTIMVGSYKQFSNLAADMFYLADKPPGSETPPIDPGNRNIFPQNKPVHFRMSDANNAFATAYDLIATPVVPPGGDVVACTHSTPEFSVLFNESLAYDVVITARNPMDSTTVTKSVEIQEMVSGFLVVDGNSQVKANEVKLLNASFTAVGTKTCVYVDFGDGVKRIYSDFLPTCTHIASFSSVAIGDKLPLSSVYTMQHVYTTDGFYTVSATAQNDHSSETLTVSFSITALDCGKPAVDIHNRRNYFTNPVVFKKSDKIQIRGLSEIHCAASYENRKSWKVEKMNENYDTVIQEISLVGIDASKAELNFPVRFLDLGLYRVHYTMTMLGSYGSNTFQATTFTYIKTEPSDLIGIMVQGGNSEIVRGTGQTVTLEPLIYSQDPDEDPGIQPDPGLTVTGWDCVKGESGNCPALTPGTSTQVLNLNSWSLTTYRITANLKKGTRTVSAQILLDVVSGNPPQVAIIPSSGSVYYQMSNGYKVLKSSRLGLDCVCMDCSASDVITYQWKVMMADYRWPDNWRPLEQVDVLDRVLGYESKQISIEASLFETFNSQQMRAECVLTRAGEWGKVASDLMVNNPPAPGTCTVSPFNRTITSEEAWTISVDSWSDEDGIDEYQFFIHTDEDTVDKQITSVKTEQGTLSIQVSLSEGPHYLNYKQTIIVKVRDMLGSIQEYDCGQVVVLPMPVEDIRALTQDVISNQKHELARMFSEGDQKTCSEKSTNIVSLLNSDKYASQTVASNQANSMYGQGDLTRTNYQTPIISQDPEEEFKMESERNDRAEVRESLIESISKLPTQSVISIQQVISFYAEATVYGDEISQDSQETVMEALENMTLFMTDPESVDKVPSEDLEVAMENGIAAIGGIMDAAGNNGYRGTLKELEEAEEDEEWFVYDSSLNALGGEDDMSSAGTFDEAMKIHTARIHKIRQAKTAERVRQRVIRTLDAQAKVFSRYSVPGQTLLMRSVKMKVIMEKTDVQRLIGKTLNPPGSTGGVTLPDNAFIGGDPEETVVASVTQSTNHPLKYSDKAKGISPSSNFISINLYDDNNSKMTVSGLVEPVKIVVPLDANMPKPSYIEMDPIISKWTNLMLLVANINRSQSAIHLDFKDIEGRQFLLVVKKGKPAKIAVDRADDECDAVYLVPSSLSSTDPDRYRFYLSNNQLGNFVGQLSIGMRELNTTEYDMDISAGCASLPRYENGSDYFQGNFSLRQYVTQCLAISDSANDWSTDGCEVSKETNDSNNVCLCNHLTTFAGGWVVVPNTIDWSYVFANADFLSNPTIYITVMLTAVLYITAAIYARYKDKKMTEQLGIAPLADNDPKDKYFYEVLVCTGMRRNAGTNSQVCFILSGEDDETDVRAFSDSKRKIFRRGQVDGFLMAVPRPLGYLNFMRVWHDNSGKGKFGSWYLNYIVVRDIQTDLKQVFISNKWYAVEEDDGQVDRVIPVAGREQLSDFSYQFGERSKKNLADGHLWFSVVARPPQSRFTCLQRVSCCLCLLYVTMLANAMFYRAPDEAEDSGNSLSFGPFSVSPEQISIGIISNLIVFPVNFLLIFLFRKSRPHHKRPSRIDRAIKEVHQQNKMASVNDVKPEVGSIFSVTKSPSMLRDPNRPASSSSSRPCSAMSTGKEELVGKKKKKFELPWYFTIIAWVVLWVVTLGAAAMVTFYGISFKDDICKKWISSMLVSFFMSVFITQPIKVFLFAMILSIIIKNPAEDKEDEEEDEEMPHMDQDNELLHGDMAAFGATRPRKIGYKPPDPMELEKHRKRRMNEIKMWAIIREVIIYSFFLWILMVISYRQLGASNFLYKDTMHRVFIENNETDIHFSLIRNTDEFWIWAKSGLVNGLRAGSYYNDYPPLKLRAYINDKVSRIIGYATMRQLRIKPALCEIPDKMETLVGQCNIQYDILKQEERDFKVGWELFNSTDTANDTRPEYMYTTAGDLNGYPYWGTLGMYSGGGYVVNLEGSKADLINIMDKLEREKWIDRYTRAVFVEFTVYNAQVNLFAISTILAEFHPSGGLVQSFRFEPAMLLPYMTSAMLFQLVCEVVYILFTLFFIIRELRAFIKQRLSYFKSFWNLVELGIIAMSIAAIVIFFYRLFVTNDLTEAFKETNGNGYVKFQYVGYWNEMFSYMIGFLCFFATIKFLKLLRFNKKISMLSATLKHSAKGLMHFGVIFVIVFMAFAQLFYLTYMHIDVDYSTFISSVVASILMMMGKFNIYSMIMTEPVLTQIFVLLYVITVTFIIVNMFISILNETFTVVREDINKQGNDYEVVDFMLQRFKKWTGLGASSANENENPDGQNNPEGQFMPGGGPNSSDHIQDFPDRIERLLQSISSVYMDNDNLGQLYQKKRLDSQNINKSMLRSGRSPSPAPGQQFRGRKDSSDVVARVHTD